MLSEYWQKLGSPQFRRHLADLVIAITPDKNLHRMRDIINTMDSETRAFFQEIKSAAHEDQATFTHGDTHSGSIMRILSTSSNLLLRPIVRLTYYVRTVRDSGLAEMEDRLTDEELLAQIS